MFDSTASSQEVYLEASETKCARRILRVLEGCGRPAHGFICASASEVFMSSQ